LTVVAVLTVRAAVDEAADRLARAGISTPCVDAEWLLAGMMRIGRSRLALQLAAPLPADVSIAYAAAVERRARREPLQQILGWEDFRGLRVRVTRDVLIPRPETETLVAWMLELLPRPGARRLRVADVGTGTGCIAWALAAERADCDVIATDVSPAAARVAQDNIRAVAGSARVVLCDVLGALRAASLDAIVANPPYLTDAELVALAPEVATYEPRVALSGGTDGLRVLTRLVDEAPRALRSGGVIALETGGGTHVDALGRRLAAVGFVDVSARADLAGVTRFVAGRRP